MLRKLFGFGKKKEEPGQAAEVESVIEVDAEAQESEPEEGEADSIDENAEAFGEKDSESESESEELNLLEEDVIDDVPGEPEIAEIESVPEEGGVPEVLEESLEEALDEPKEERKSFFQRLKEGLAKTQKTITDKIDNLLNNYGKIDEELFEELEEILITADIGMNTTMEIIDRLRDELVARKISDSSQVKAVLRYVMTDMMRESNNEKIPETTPLIILVIGVNGAGKTTSIGKIANRYKNSGKKVLLAAGDTFRAAAVDQLKIWGERAAIPVISHQEGSDPAAVIYDAIQAAKAREIDVLICDTAGRLHNKVNLMNELNKIFRVVEKEYSEAAKEVLLVLDGTTGQNAIAQAKVFKEAANISGIVLTKLDGTAKGGVVLSINRELGIPVKLIGVGEGINDLQEFDPESFVSALLNIDEQL